MTGPGIEPLVSVFTGAYEIGAGIEVPFRSLLAQSYRSWEWVIVDDSPGSETWEHLRGVAESDAAAGRLRLYRQEPSTGSIGATKAAAAGLCRGEILVELDHDDELLPETLDTLVAGFQRHPEVDFLYSDCVDALDTGGAGIYPPGWGMGFGAYASEVVRGGRVPVALSPPITWETVRHIVSAPNHVRAWRRDFYRRIGGHDPGLEVGDDYELVIRTFLEGTMGRVPRPLYVQHHRADGSTASRRRNPDIQNVVAVASTHYEDALNRRCLELGMSPWPGPASPWTSPAPISQANVVVDVLAEASEQAGVPLISVVLPTYDRPDPLRVAIESVLAQTYSNLELLVVGDACPSVDAVVAGYGDPRLRHWNLPDRMNDLGASPRNYATKAMARGTIVTQLDDDDAWEPDRLELLVQSGQTRNR
jgi:glycosyltransferase involved in cell wall biosynthesis